MRRYLIVFWSFLILFLGIACDDLLEEEDISNREVVLNAPSDGSILTANTVNFNWETVEDATDYRVQIATPNFEAPVQILLDSIIVEDTLGMLTTRLNQSLLNGNYVWRVQASNSGFSTPYSEAGFTVNGDENADLISPNTPVLTTPQDGSTQDSAEVDFSWTREDVPGTAERDSIFIFSDAGLQTLAVKDIGANKTYSATLDADTTYSWFVKAYDTAGNQSDDSVVFSLTIN